MSRSQRLAVWSLLLASALLFPAQTRLYSAPPLLKGAKAPISPERLPAHPPASPSEHGRLREMRHPLVVASPKATKAYRRTFRILMGNPEKTDRFDELILKYAAQHGLDPRLMKSIMAAESEFNPKALSPVGATGLLQLMPATAEEMGVARGQLQDPEQNIRAGAAYLDHLFSRVFKRYRLKGVDYKDAPVWIVQRVVAAYHAGPRFLYRNNWYRSTRLYVRKVLLFYQSPVTDVRRLPEPAFQLPPYPLGQSLYRLFPLIRAPAPLYAR